MPSMLDTKNMPPNPSSLQWLTNRKVSTLCWPNVMKYGRTNVVVGRSSRKDTQQNPRTTLYDRGIFLPTRHAFQMLVMAMACSLERCTPSPSPNHNLWGNVRHTGQKQTEYLYRLFIPLQCWLYFLRIFSFFSVYLQIVVGWIAGSGGTTYATESKKSSSSVCRFGIFPANRKKQLCYETCA